MNEAIPIERIENKIYLIRGQKVMIDADLAGLYGLATRDLNKAVSRNLERFPVDFMFQLNKSEYENLKFQFGTSSWGGRRKRPRAFTEQGIAMLSSVLNSQRAIQVNIIIIRTFVKIRRLISTHQELLAKLNELEGKTESNTADIQLIFETIRKMLVVEEKPAKRIGFLT